MKNFKIITLILLFSLLGLVTYSQVSQEVAIRESLKGMLESDYAKEETMSKEIYTKLEILEKEWAMKNKAIAVSAGDNAKLDEQIKRKKNHDFFLNRTEYAQKKIELFKQYAHAYASPYYMLYSPIYGSFEEKKKYTEQHYQLLSVNAKHSLYGLMIKHELKRLNFDINKDLVITGNADRDYDKLDNLTFLDNMYNTQDSNGNDLSMEKVRLRSETHAMKRREFGLRLWGRYPNDVRRYEWFKKTVLDAGANTLNYWHNIAAGNLAFYSRPVLSENYSSPINGRALFAWEQAYPEMKKQYFENFKGSQKDRILCEYAIGRAELLNFIKLSSNAEYLKYNKEKKIDLKKLEGLLIQATGKLSEMIVAEKNPNPEMGIMGHFLVKALTYDLRSCFTGKENAFGITDQELLDMYKRFIKHNYNYCLTELSKNKVTLLSLKTEPFKLKATAINGREIDMDKMLGKVVLVDFWATGCISCIARMPAIKSIYDKYKNLDFEVISACLNFGDETQRIKAIDKKIGANWPLVLIGSIDKSDYDNSTGIRLFRKYGLAGVPQMFLFNKKGELEMYNASLLQGDFEPLVKKLLAEKI